MKRILLKFPGKLDFWEMCIHVYQYVIFLGFTFCRECKQDTMKQLREVTTRSSQTFVLYLDGHEKGLAHPTVAQLILSDFL